LLAVVAVVAGMVLVVAVLAVCKLEQLFLRQMPHIR
jgi:hypothetical protein